MRYRKLVLRMYWDGEKEPSVEVPLGDFFGWGLDTLRYFHSQIVYINKGPRGGDFDGLVNCFPMPFQKSARITLENDGKNQMYKFYINDPVRFQNSIRVTIEHGHASNFENDCTRALDGVTGPLPAGDTVMPSGYNLDVSRCMKLS